MSAEDMVYVATAPCGCVHGVDCENGSATARNVADWIHEGSTVDRRPFVEAKAALMLRCPHVPMWGRS